MADVTGTGALFQAAQTLNAVGAETSPGGGFLLPNQPNIVDFEWFLSNSVQIPPAPLPASSPWPQYALTQALRLTPCGPGGIMYTLVVYNCATHLLFAITPDVAGQNYFGEKRGAGAGGYGLVNPIAGMVVSTFDQGTGTTVNSPDWAKKMTMGQLDFTRSPWGRYYLNWIQSAGPYPVGLT